MGDQDADDSIDIVPSGIAMAQVSAWLGVKGEEVLQQETDPAVEAMFAKPHPSLLGLGAKYLSHKSMEQSGVDLKLRQRLRTSTVAAGADGGSGGGYQPAQLDRHAGSSKRRRLEAAGPQQEQQQRRQHSSSAAGHQGGSSDEDEEDAGGKLGRLQRGSSRASDGGAAAAPHQPQAAAYGKHKVLDRQQLLATPAQQLSKWQRKRQRQKERKQQQQQQQQQEDRAG